MRNNNDTADCHISVCASVNPEIVSDGHATISCLTMITPEDTSHQYCPKLSVTSTDNINVHDNVWYNIIQYAPIKPI